MATIKIAALKRTVIPVAYSKHRDGSTGNGRSKESNDCYKDQFYADEYST